MRREAGVRTANERGSVTIVAAGVLGMVVVATMGVADVGRALVARTHAQAAADAAALAAAQELALASGVDPAAQAADYADRNGATLLSCACPPGGVEAIVEVSVDVGPFLLLPGDRTLVARARAIVDAPTP